MFEGHDAVSGDGGGDGVAVGTRSFFAEPVEELSCVVDFAFSIVQRFAVLPGDEGCEVGCVFLHEIVPFSKHVGSFSRKSFAK